MIFLWIIMIVGVVTIGLGIIKVNRELSRELEDAKSKIPDREHDEFLEVTTRWSEGRFNPADGTDLHEHAVITWDFNFGHSVPADAINSALSKLYNQDYFPFLYTWWDENGDEKGLLLTATMNLEREEVSSICTIVVNSTKNTGDWSTKVEKFEA